MADAIPSRPPLSSAEGWNPPSRDFFGGPPPVGEVLPDAVFVDGAIVVPPKQARGYVAFAPLLDRIGPGAAAMVEREMDRARGFEVIARAAVALVDNAHDPHREAWVALLEAVAENRAAIS